MALIRGIRFHLHDVFSIQLQVFSVLLFLVLIIMQRKEADAEWISVPEFFPEIKNNLTKVTWAHGVNSMEKLKAAIEGPVMMLEGDVLMGTTPASSEVVPIMAHPPSSTSDLTFKGFLETVIVFQAKEKRKGIKLDFKDILSVDPVLRILQSAFNEGKLKFPVWINADVLKGPIKSTKEPIHGTAFINLVKKYLPSATLSLGWTTRYGRDEIKDAEYRNISNHNLRMIKSTKHGYNEENVNEMVQLILDTHWEGPVTFAVRAGLVTQKDATRYLGRLMTETMNEEVSFTIWSPADDLVDVKALRDWIFYTYDGEVYVDLPFDLESGPVLIPDPVRPIGRTDHLQSSSSFSTKSSFLYLTLVILTRAFFFR